MTGYGHIARDVAVNFLTKYAIISKYNEKDANKNIRNN